ncbi:MAG: hypothetical protein JWR26_4659 [Pedosphaera sp.]|nr:hypothetical protein [Pedosphaera sp.]
MRNGPKKHSSNTIVRVEPSRRAVLKVKRSIFKKLRVRMGAEK